MIEVYTKKNKLFSKFKTDSIPAALKKLRQLNIINNIKYLIVTSYDKICTYICGNCHKRTYIDFKERQNMDIICDHCKQDNELFFVGFKQSENQTEVKYAV